MKLKPTYRTKFTEVQLNTLNTICNDSKRKKTMSVLQYIVKYQSTETGYLDISLDRLYKKFKRYHKNISLTYFKSLTELLVDMNLLDIKQVGKLKYYGSSSKVSVSKKLMNKVDEKKDLTEQYISQLEQEIELLKAKILNRDNIDIDKGAQEPVEVEVNISQEDGVKKEYKKDYGRTLEVEEVANRTWEILELEKVEPCSLVAQLLIESIHQKYQAGESINALGLDAFIYRALKQKQDYASSRGKKTQAIKNETIKKADKPMYNGFNNFKPREYDYNDLEARLTDWN